MSQKFIMTAAELGAFTAKHAQSTKPTMTDRDRLAEKLFLRHLHLFSNKPELTAKWSKDSANIFFDTLEANNNE